MPIEGIIAGLTEINDRFDLGVHRECIKDAIEALAEVDKNLDEAYAAGKYDQLCEDFADVIEEIAKGGRGCA